MSASALNPVPLDAPVTLRARVLRAGAWTLGSHFGVQAIRLGGNLLMTRLLVPEMFGVMAIAHVFMTALAMFSDLGLVQNIVQSRRGSDPAFLMTAWSVQVVRGLIIAAAAVGAAAGLRVAAGAGLFAPETVYADPVLPTVLAVLSCSAIIAGLESVRIAQLRRALDLARLARLELISAVSALAIMGLWGLVAPSIWALVAGGIGGAVARTTLSHLILPGPADRWGFEADALRELLGFGRWIFLSSILGFLVINGDRLLLGGLIDAHTLGLFSIAAMLVMALDQVMAKLIGDVAYPALSEVARQRPEQLRATLYRFHRAVGAPAMAAAGFLVAMGPTIVALLYDHRYAGAGAMLAILGLGLATVPARVASQAFLALGDSRILSVLTAIRLPALVVATPMAFQAHGLEAALWAIVASTLTCVPVIWVCQARTGMFDWRREAEMVLPALAGLAAGYGALRLADLLGLAPTPVG
jgi:O-antigen/teichoic acid export membrane protein